MQTRYCDTWTRQPKTGYHLIELFFKKPTTSLILCKENNKLGLLKVWTWEKYLPQIRLNKVTLISIEGRGIFAQKCETYTTNIPLSAVWTSKNSLFRTGLTENLATVFAVNFVLQIGVAFIALLYVLWKLPTKFLITLPDNFQLDL